MSNAQPQIYFKKPKNKKKNSTLHTLFSSFLKYILPEDDLLWWKIVLICM